MTAADFPPEPRILRSIVYIIRSIGPWLESVFILILVMKIALQGWAERSLAGIAAAVEPPRAAAFAPC